MKYMDIIYSGCSQVAINAGYPLLRPLALLLVVILAYLIGSVNFGVIISRRLYHEDVREQGSGNSGSTNMLRTYGIRASILTFLGDFLKGALAVCVGIFLWGYVGGYTAFFFAVFGHAFPVYFKFQGGKGIATTAGALFVLNTTVFLILVLIFVVLVWISRFVSLGSIMAAMLLPLFVNRFGAIAGLLIGYGNPANQSPVCTLISFAVAAMVILLHRKNLVRLLKGQEAKISIGSRKKQADKDAGGVKP